MTFADVRTAPAIESLETWRNALRARLRQNFAANASALLGFVRDKLSGEVLRPKSGALRASIHAEVAEDAAGFAARVWSEGALSYAHVQEYGGRIEVPAIAPKTAGALAFAYGGRMVFAKRARAHVVEMPAHSYMRTSLAEFAPLFADGIRKLAADVCR